MKPKWQSKSINTAAVIAILGVVEVNFHMLQDMLGQYYGLSFVVFAVIMAYLRMITTGPVK